MYGIISLWTLHVYEYSSPLTISYFSELFINLNSLTYILYTYYEYPYVIFIIHIYKD